jgi:hypothetical protein
VEVLLPHDDDDDDKTAIYKFMISELEYLPTALLIFHQNQYKMCFTAVSIKGGK